MNQEDAEEQAKKDMEVITRQATEIALKASEMMRDAGAARKEDMGYQMVITGSVVTRLMLASYVGARAVASQEVAENWLTALLGDVIRNIKSLTGDDYQVTVMRKDT